jgi:hypothetical protein
MIMRSKQQQKLYEHKNQSENTMNEIKTLRNLKFIIIILINLKLLVVM